MTRDRLADAAAVMLGLAVLYAGVTLGSTVAGGADSFGYISQAGLWQAGGPTIQQDIVGDSPWPDAASTWAPLGYLPSGAVRGVIVPTYAPGYPLLVAAAQFAAGYCAGFLVVPMCGLLTIVATYLLARRIFPGRLIALGASLLVATSPVFLSQLMNPMSDIPVTAAWAAALALAVWNYPLCAGAAAGAAIAIRPNLAPLALLLVGWLAAMDRRAVARAAIGVAPALVGIAWGNAQLYGSPFTSGYGSLSELYALGNFSANMRRFAEWTFAVQTPLAALAAAYFVVPRWMPAQRVPGARFLLGGTLAVVVGSYLFYLPFDAWWYLRFLLPAWPVLLMLCAAGIDAIVRRWAMRFQVPAVAAVLVGWSAYGLHVAASRAVFELGRGERVYVDVGRYVGAHTEPDAVILSMQHSGSIRWYADRLTLRYDRIEPAWLDRVLDHLQARGRHPYLVLAEFEEAEFRRRFAAVSRIGALDWKPIAVYPPTRVAVYDVADRSATQSPTMISATGRTRARWRCDPPQIWPPRRRTK